MKKMLVLFLFTFLLSGCLLDAPDNAEDYHRTERISVEIGAGNDENDDTVFQFYIRQGEEPVDELTVTADISYRGERWSEQAEYVSSGLYQVPLTDAEDGLYEVRLSTEIEGQPVTPGKYIGLGQLTDEEMMVLEGESDEASGGHHH